MTTEATPPRNDDKKKITLVITKETDTWQVVAYIGNPKADAPVFGYAKRKDREEVLMLVVKMVLDAYPNADIELWGDLPEEVTRE